MLSAWLLMRYMNMHHCFVVAESTLFTNNLLECYEVLLLYQVSLVSDCLWVSYMEMYLPIVYCCGSKRPLFTNKLYWYQYKLYHFMHVKFLVSKRNLMSFFDPSINSLSLPSYMHWCTIVSEICELNKKKMNNSEMVIALVDPHTFSKQN